MKFTAVIALMVLASAAAAARAHFVFVVPQADGRSAKVFMSEDLKPDDDVGVELIAGAKLAITDAAGHDERITLGTPDGHAFDVPLAGQGNRVVHGTAEIGVQTRGSVKPYLLTYYPKTIVGDAFAVAAPKPPPAPIELTPRGQSGDVRLLLSADGQPVGNAEVDLIEPDGSEEKVTTDEAGLTPPLVAPGRYGAWARHFRAGSGHVSGQQYDELHDYATLVFDNPIAGHAAASAASPTTQGAKYPAMPQAASSFGAVASNGWLYVYGGHIADTHSYTTASVSGQFHRLNLADAHAWETLPAGPALQGMNLAAYAGRIYRVGGMAPKNSADQDDDVRSVADAAVFDPATLQWLPLPSLPAARSSHDVAVVGSTLYVVGGWTLKGDPGNAEWAEELLSLDLSVPNAQWQALSEPFRRRALIAAGFSGKLYAIGGFETENAPSRHVEIFDPRTGGWSAGPDLPPPDMNAFGPAACVSNGRLYVSVASGTLYVLAADGNGWEAAGQTTPRIVHRMVPNGNELLVLGGAIKRKQTALIESVVVPH